MFGISSSLVDNAWRDLTRRGMTVTTTREPGWKWFPEEKYRTQVILKRVPRLRQAIPSP